MTQDWVPVDEGTLERVRTGLPLRDVGRIDLRPLRDDLSLDVIAEVRHRHRLDHRYGHEAPIRLRERQCRSLAISCGYGVTDEDDNPIDFTLPGSRVFGHELWVEADS